MTWTHSAGVASNTTAQNNFLWDVARGKVAGHSDEFLIGLNRNVGATLEDVWGAGEDITFPTSGEQWEILSDDANDTFGGSGARVCVLLYLDDNYDDQQAVIVMNGTTPVVTTATNIFRPKVLLVVSSGASKANEGSITCRVAGGGAARNFVHPDFGFSFDGHMTIPRAKTGLMTFAQVNAGRNDGVEFRLRFSIGEVGNFGIVQYNNLFETVANTPLPVPIAFNEKTDIIMAALNSAGGSGADCFAVCQFVFIDN